MARRSTTPQVGAAGARLGVVFPPSSRGKKLQASDVRCAFQVDAVEGTVMYVAPVAWVKIVLFGSSCPAGSH